MGRGGGLGTRCPFFPVGLPRGVPWRFRGWGGGGSIQGPTRSPKFSQAPSSGPRPPLSPAGPTWGPHKRTDTTRCRDRHPSWSWGHGAAGIATRGESPVTPASSSGRAESSTWPPASASSSWWEKPWVSGGCRVRTGWSPWGYPEWLPAARLVPISRRGRRRGAGRALHCFLAGRSAQRGPPQLWHWVTWFMPGLGWEAFSMPPRCPHGPPTLRRWVPGAQPGHPDGRSPPPDGLRQHHDQPLRALGVLAPPNQNHELRLAPGR